jgi:hypothetical protein
MTKAHNDFLNRGHALILSGWTAWWTAYQYAAETKSPLLSLIDKGCDFAERQRPVPAKYLRAAEQLFQEALSAAGQKT